MSTPSTASPSSSDHTAQSRKLHQPSELATSYFPSGASPDLASPTDSETSPPSSAQPLFLNSPIGIGYSLPALAREFKKPDNELDVAAQLAKKPLPRSLYSSLEIAARRQAPVEDPELKARKFEEAKRQWEAWKA